MKKSFTIILSTIVAVCAIATNYFTLWQNVDNLTSESNLSMAEKEINQIMETSIKEGNDQQMLRSLIMMYANKMGCTYTLDDTTTYHFPPNLNQEEGAAIIEEMYSKTRDVMRLMKDSVVISLTNAFLADLVHYRTIRSYTHYNTQKEVERDVESRNLSDLSPSEMNHLRQIHLDRAISNMEELSRHTTNEYNNLLFIRKDADTTYMPTMMDVIGRIYVDCIPLYEYSHRFNQPQLSKKKASEIYSKMAEIHRQRRDTAAHIYCLYKGIDGDDSTKVDAYTKLIDEYSDHEVSLLIVAARNSIWLKEIDTVCHSDEFTQDRPQMIADICDKYIAKYPKSKLIEPIKQQRRQILKPTLIAFAEKQNVSSSDTLEIGVRYTNIAKLNVYVFRIDRPAAVFHTYVEKREIIEHMQLVDSFAYALEPSNYYIPLITSIKLRHSLPYGVYAVIAEDAANDNVLRDIKKKNEDLQFIEMHVTDITAFSWNICDISDGQSAAAGSNTVYAVDLKSGKPLKDVSVTRVTSDSRHTVMTDKDGEADIPNKKGHYWSYCHIEKGDDRFSPSVQTNYDNIYLNKKEQYHFTIRTDRAVYRPGQVVNVKAILTKALEKECVVVPNTSIKIQLRDANNKSVKSETLTTNEFGSCSTSFTIPTDRLSGSWRIDATLTEPKGKNVSTAYEGRYIRVEEYKRPSIELTMAKMDSNLTYSHDITIRGSLKALSGEGIANARIELNGKLYYDGNFYSQDGDDHTATTDEKGDFSVTIKPKRQDDKTKATRYSYDVTAVSPSGESTTDHISFYVTEHDLTLAIEQKQTIDLNVDQYIHVSALSYSGDAKTAHCTVSLICSKTKESVKSWQQTIHGSDSIHIAASTLKPGDYTIKLSSPYGIECSHDITAYDSECRQAMPSKALWAHLGDGNTTQQWTADESHDLYISSCNDAHVLIVYADQLCRKRSARWIQLHSESRKFTIKASDIIGEGEGRGTISVISVYDGKLYEHVYTIQRKEVEQSLDVKLSTFRDQTTPGAEETWTITVEGTDKAELLCAMYDRSLDAIARLDWNKQVSPYSARQIQSQFPSFYIHSPGNGRWSIYSIQDHYPSGGSYQINMTTFPIWWQIMYDYIKSSNLSVFTSVDLALQGRVAGVTIKGTASLPLKMNSSMGNTLVHDMADSAEEEERCFSVAPMLNADDPAGPASLKLRSDFSETALWMPHVMVDSGKATITFTMPESLTQWAFRAFAHDKQSRCGYTIQDIVTTRPLSIRPYIPRFFRSGDDCVISAVCMSKDSKPLTATLKAVDEQSGRIILDETVSVSKASNAEWRLSIPSGTTAMRLTLSTSDGTDSDAEMHIVPVIEDRIRVVSSENVLLHSGETHTITTQADSTALYTLEYTPNAAWAAITAIPSLSDDIWHGAISLSRHVMLNSLAANIGGNYPEIVKTIEQWQRDGAATNHLTSPLLQNEELKSTLLSQTPWVVEAEREQHWKSELCHTLNPNRATRDAHQSLKKLKRLQQADGGFVWFEGARSSSPWITMIVCESLLTLSEYGCLSSLEGANSMLTKAIRYLDSQIERELDGKSIPTSEYTLHYLMLRSKALKICPLSSKQSAIFHTLLDKATKESRNLTLIGRSQLAVAQHLSGATADARRTIEMLRGTASHSHDKGMYWKGNQDSRYCNSAVISHAAAMRAICLVDRQEEEMAELMQWIIARKRTTMWYSERIACETVSSLLLCGLPTKGGSSDAKVEIDGKAAVGDQSGYIKMKIDDPATTHSISIHQLGGFGFGAVYADRMIAMSDVEQTSSGITLHEEAFLEVTEGGKTILRPITADTKIERGDRICVRMNVKNEQKLDFVCLTIQMPSCCEPSRAVSGYTYSSRLWYYQTHSDTQIRLFFEQMPQGSYVLEQTIIVTSAGSYTPALSTIESQYAPSYRATSKADRRLTIE